MDTVLMDNIEEVRALVQSLEDKLNTYEENFNEQDIPEVDAMDDFNDAGTVMAQVRDQLEQSNKLLDELVLQLQEGEDGSIDDFED